MTDTTVPVIGSNLTQLSRAGIYAGQVWGRIQTGAILDPFDDAVGAIALAGVSAIGHGNKFWLQAAQAVNVLPQGVFHLAGARREELE
ncbi:hypothetical protein D3C71_2106260 [compost metagenome]